MGKRIAMVGSGAIGGYMGAHMVRAGEDVTFIDAWPEHVETMRRDGLSVKGMEPGYDFTTPVKALHVGDVQSLMREAPIDIAFISVKSYDTAWATQLILPYLAEDGVLVSLQNGINEDAIAGVAGWGRTLGCCVGMHGGEMTAAGVVERTTPLNMTGKPELLVGEVHGRITPRAIEIANLLSCAAPASTTSNLWGVRWSKLIINAMRNGVSAATGLGGKARDSNDEALWLTLRLGAQAIRVGRAMGLSLEPIAFDLDAIVRAGDGDAAAREQIKQHISKTMSGRADTQRPSMGQDILKGRRTETDFINGLVARRGKEYGVDASLHEKLNDIIRRVERGQVAPSLELIAGL
ncbi:MAG TPA: 2-dehydropantoate 2-reductase [Caulobacteraceae bacterium]|jgi:2-dehydropantoate 2-reductase|nr:2-dehydropantoate 2-reductase [Caulobacteraceae bacterium]